MKPSILAPHKDLAAFVMCYWVLESPAEDTPQKNTIVPDGTMKMIFHYGAPYRHYSNQKERIELPKAFVIGQLSKPYVVEPTGNTGTFFVRFHPNGFLPFSDRSIKDMENQAVSLEALYGDTGRLLAKKILHASNTATRIKCIETFLRQILQDKQRIDQLVAEAVDTIATANGRLAVQELSEKVQTNRRNLVRKFSKQVGISPKQLSKIMRLQHTIKMLLTDEVSNFTELAHENTYFDQAHFNKDFKSFTGLTPKEFYGDDLKMSFIFDSKS